MVFPPVDFPVPASRGHRTLSGCTTFPMRRRDFSELTPGHRWTRERLEGTEAKKGPCRPSIPRSTKRWNQFWRSRAFSVGARSFGNARAAPRGRGHRNWTPPVVFAFCYLCKKQRIGAQLKIARSAFHGFFTNNSTRERHTNSSKQAHSPLSQHTRRDLDKFCTSHFFRAQNYNRNFLREI